MLCFQFTKFISAEYQRSSKEMKSTVKRKLQANGCWFMCSGNILFHTLVSGKICFESHRFWITQSLQECIHCIKWTHSEDIITFSQELGYPNALGSYISHFDLHFESWLLHQSPMTLIIMSHLWWYWGKSISWFIRGCCYLMQQLSPWHATASSSPTWTPVSSISMPTWGIEIESQGLLWGVNLARGV